MEDDNNTASKLMNDEIKEILARLKNNDFERDCNDGSCYKELYLSEIETLLDYITNLRQENQELKSELECYENGVYFSSKVDELERENERLKEKNKALQEDAWRNNANLMEMVKEELEKTDCKECEICEDYKSRIEKAVEYIKKYTRWFDSEYAKVYGELCTCAGANANRLEVLVNPSNLLNILNERSDE